LQRGWNIQKEIETSSDFDANNTDSIIFSVFRSTDLIIIIWHINKDTAV
jgi:hypothetical protein